MDTPPRPYQNSHPPTPNPRQMTRTRAHTVQIEDSGAVDVPVTRQWMRRGPEEGGLVVLSRGEGMGLVRDQRKRAGMGEVLVDPWVPTPNPD